MRSISQCVKMNLAVMLTSCWTTVRTVTTLIQDWRITTTRILNAMLILAHRTRVRPQLKAHLSDNEVIHQRRIGEESKRHQAIYRRLKVNAIEFYACAMTDSIASRLSPLTFQALFAKELCVWLQHNNIFIQRALRRLELQSSSLNNGKNFTEMQKFCGFIVEILMKTIKIKVYQFQKESFFKFSQ